MLAFSNGVESSVRILLERAGVLSYFDGVVSTNDVKTFKPSQDVYAYLVSRGGRESQETWLISANSFDV
jgi:2-haloacid dehalogenase